MNLSCYHKRMATAILFFLLSCIFSVVTSQQRTYNISLGSSISPINNNRFWLSNSSNFAFGFYPKGNGFAVGIWLEKIQQRTVIWTANRDNPPLSRDVTLNLSNDGRRLFLQLNQGQQILIANTSQAASSAAMLDSGNFVLYSSDRKIIWQTFDAPTDTILPGQSLRAPKTLISSISATNHSSGNFGLRMRTNGNLVLYKGEITNALWKSATIDFGNDVSLSLDSNGKLFLQDSMGNNVKILKDVVNISRKAIYRATIDVDGVFRLYSHNLAQNSDWSIEWSTPSASEGERKQVNQQLEMKILITGIVFLTISFVVLAIFGLLICRRRVWKYKIVSIEGSDEPLDDVILRSFKYEELKKATNNFVHQIGKGGFGTVFKGFVSNGNRVVAIKRLDAVVAEGEWEFRNEMRVIGRTHHRNLVSLLGYCHDRTNRLLVYEYMSNGSLADFLFRTERKPAWNERIEIALNIARGILYLHEECETQIIHCDIKPENILMDENEIAKIADFGLSKLLMPDQSRTYTRIRGTRGYVAPEWHKNLPITVKVDVFSYGIMLLEIICCRRSMDANLPENEVVLAYWVYDCFEANEFGRLVQGEEIEMDRLERMIKVGLWCIQDEPQSRPSMKKVVLMLEGTIGIPSPPSPASFVSSEPPPNPGSWDDLSVQVVKS